MSGRPPCPQMQRFAVGGQRVTIALLSLRDWISGRDVMDQPFSGETVSEKGSPRRLDSWKEIAAYLKRYVTTVQRWERREGMPVHRHVHDRAGSVYAFPAELDEWLRSRKPRLGEEEKELVAQTPGGAPAGMEMGRRMTTFSPRVRRWIAVSGVVLLAFFAAAYAITRSRAAD